MASPALEKLWAEQAAQRKASGYTPSEYVPPDTAPRILGVRITEDEDKSFGQKMLQDGALLSYGALTGVAKLGTAAVSLPLTPFSEKARETVTETGKMFYEGFKQTAIDIGGATGLLGAEQQRESLDYYKAHPMMAMLDIWGVASLGTGTVLKSALTGTARGAMASTIRAGMKMGIKEEVMRSAFQVSRSFLSPARIIGKTEKVAYPLERALYKAVRTGNVDEVASAITTKLIKEGVDPKKASELAQVAAKETADNIARQSTRLKTLDAFTHPASAAFRGGSAIATKISGVVLGNPSESAVAGAFGKAVIDTNKKSALMMERWLEAVTGERGWENTMENRTRIFQEIKAKPDFVGLSPDEFFAHFDNYVKADISVARLRQMTNNPSYIPVKTISKDTAESMAQTLESNFDDITSEAMGAARVGVENVVDKGFEAISEFMRKNFRRDFENFEVLLRRAFGEKGNKESLIATIRGLSENKPHLNGQGWSKEVTAMIEDMKGTGYQIGLAPTGKKVTLAAEVVGELLPTSPSIKYAQMYSPNIADNFSYERAVKNLDSPEQARIKSVADDINSDSGLTGKPKNVIGDTKEYGIENALLENGEAPSIEATRYAAAQKGLAANQKTVLNFIEDINGKDGLHIIEHKLDNDAIKKILDDNGLEFRTLDKGKLIIYDEGIKLVDSLNKVNQQINGKLTTVRGTGEFIGGETRAAGLQSYKRIISEHEASKVLADSGLPKTAEEGRGIVSAIPESALESNRNYLGRVLDNWGLTFKGVVEGTSQFMFRQAWIQHAFKDVGEKFGNIITIKRPVTGIKGIRTIKIPVGKLFEWLDDHKQEFFSQRAMGAGVLPQFRIRTVFDITIDDLVNMGFEPDVAKTISSISKKSLREIPVSVTGIADKLVNIMRGADGVFKGFGEFYDKWAIKTPTYMRYQSPLSFMFQSQQFIETKIMGAMLTKDFAALPGIQKLAGFGGRMIPERVGGILQRAKIYLREITAEPSLNDLAIVRDELITDVQKVINDSFGTSEFQSVTQGAKRTVAETGAEILSRSHRDSLWMRAFGGFHMNTGAKISKGIAKKFGMTIEEAVAKNADGAYLHPRLVREMQDTVRSALTYSHGFQTSPLVKTMNIVWFPFRFQAKTIQTTAKWLSELSPVSRAVVINNWVHFSNWAGTDDGIEWRKSHQNLLYSILAYTTAAEQIGDSLDAISRGQLFGGNTGLIGGIPFGFVYNLATELALLPEDPEQFDPATGKSFQFKKTPKEIISYGSFVKALEEFVFMMAPGMPLYTVSGGVVRGASYRHMIQKIVEDTAGWAQAKYEGVDPKLGKTLLEREFMRVRPGETRF